MSAMKVQVLVATTNQNDHSLLEKMNISTDALVGNQCDFNGVENFDFKGNKITYLNFAEKGVGLNRNNTLMRARGDVLLFADDDLVYDEGYAEVLINAFEENPKADVIVFNLKEENSHRKQITKRGRVGYFNYLRYGTARIAVRLDPIRKKGIYFNQCFGGGTEHCHGEDNLFLNACLKNRLKIIALPITLATLTNERKSSWNTGYNEKYIKDQGVLYRTLSPKGWRLLCLQDALRRHKSYNKSFKDTYFLMIQGAK